MSYEGPPWAVLALVVATRVLLWALAIALGHEVWRHLSGRGGP